MDRDVVNESVGPARRLRVAIVGAGPSGSALAILLAREGAAVTLIDDGRGPGLLVGESLVPAVVPILQRLDIEKETASFSRVKPGVSFVWSGANRVSVTFNRFAPAVFPYAYNVPRPAFRRCVARQGDRRRRRLRHHPSAARAEHRSGHGRGALARSRDACRGARPRRSSSPI